MEVSWWGSAAITNFISIHVFLSWLMAALVWERCADCMWSFMGNGLWEEFRRLKLDTNFFTIVFKSLHTCSCFCLLTGCLVFSRTEEEKKTLMHLCTRLTSQPWILDTSIANICNDPEYIYFQYLLLRNQNNVGSKILQYKKSSLFYLKSQLFI